MNTIVKLLIAGFMLLPLAGCSNQAQVKPHNNQATTVKVVKENVSFKRPAKPKFKQPKFDTIMPDAKLRYHDLMQHKTVYSNLDEILQKNKND